MALLPFSSGHFSIRCVLLASFLSRWLFHRKMLTLLVLHSLLLLLPLGAALYLYLDLGRDRLVETEQKLVLLQWIDEVRFFDLLPAWSKPLPPDRSAVASQRHGLMQSYLKPAPLDRGMVMADAALARLWRQLPELGPAGIPRRTDTAGRQALERLQALLVLDFRRRTQGLLSADTGPRVNTLRLLLTEAMPELMLEIGRLQGLAEDLAEGLAVRAVPPGGVRGSNPMVLELGLARHDLNRLHDRLDPLLEASEGLPNSQPDTPPDLGASAMRLRQNLGVLLGLTQEWPATDAAVVTQVAAITAAAETAIAQSQSLAWTALDLYRHELQQRAAQQRWDNRQAQLIGLLILLPLLALSYLIAQRGAQTLQQIIATLNRLGAGDYANHLDFDPDSANELQQLSQSLMALQGHLQDARQRTKLANETSLKTIYELHFFKYALDEHAIVSMADADGNIIDVNDAFCRVSGFTRRELIGQNHRMIKSDHHPAAFFQELWGTISRGKTWHGEIKNRAKDGTHYWVRATIAPFIGDEGPERYVSIRTDITEMKQVQAELEEAMRSKDRFLATMSHELRTPLTSILGYSEVLGHALTQPDQREQLNHIRVAGASLLSLINDILDLSKIESGNFSIDPNPFNLQQLLRDVMTIFQVRARDENVRLELISDTGHPAAAKQLIGDGNRLRQVLINLVGNAVKFSKDKSVLLEVRYQTLSAARVMVHFSVTDTGIGMSEAVQKRLFQPFEQADNSISRRFGGTGLGLFISQQLVVLMGGHISVVSRPGEGSCFSFSLEMACTELAASSPGELRRGESIPVLQGRVLIADDTPEIRHLIEGLVRSTGAEVVGAEDGQQAFDRAMGDSFDLILMDMQMPNMNGIEATSLLRQLGNDTPVYALTANVMQSHRDEFQQAGCNGFLVKPIERQKLFDALEQHLAPGSAGPAPSSPQDPLQEARAIFIAGLELKAEQIDQCLAAADWTGLQQVIHTLKGNGGTFGFPQITEQARAVEDRLKSGQLADLQQHIDALQASLRQITQQD
jgi:PAS domain S-box-containing protein